MSPTSHEVSVEESLHDERGLGWRTSIVSPTIHEDGLEILVVRELRDNVQERPGVRRLKQICHQSMDTGVRANDFIYPKPLIGQSLQILCFGLSKKKFCSNTPTEECLLLVQA